MQWLFTCLLIMIVPFLMPIMLNTHQACPQRLLHRITKFRRAHEDTSIIVIDLLPPNKQTFAEVAGVVPSGKRNMFNRCASRSRIS